MKYKWYFCKLLVHKRTQISIAILVKETIERKKLKLLTVLQGLDFARPKSGPALVACVPWLIVSKKYSDTREGEQGPNAKEMCFRFFLILMRAIVKVTRMTHSNIRFTGQEMTVVGTISSKINPSAIRRCACKDVDMA